MHFRDFIFAGSLLSPLAAAMNLVPLTSTGSVASVAKRSAQAKTLKPISLSDFHGTMGRRDTSNTTNTDFDSLTPSEQASFLYGLPAENGEAYFMANMTLHADDGKLIVGSERFDGLTTAVDCNASDNKMSFTFKNKAGLDGAIQAWDWVNENENHTFILIANNEACTKDEQRQPYMITAVDYDETNFIASLAASATTWDQVSDNIELDFGRVTLPSSSKLRKRLTYDKSKTVDLDHSAAAKDLITYSEAPNSITVTCANCSTSGELDFAGHFKFGLTSVKEAWFSANLKDFAITLDMEVKLKSVKSMPNQSVQTMLFQEGLPGLSIPEIFTIGPNIQYDVGITTSLTGEMDFTTGATAVFDKSPEVYVDFQDTSKSNNSGWEPSFSHMEPKISAELTGSIDFWAAPTLALSFDILDNKFFDGYQAAFQLKAPDLTFSAALGTNACTTKRGLLEGRDDGYGAPAAASPPVSSAPAAASDAPAAPASAASVGSQGAANISSSALPSYAAANGTATQTTLATVTKSASAAVATSAPAATSSASVAPAAADSSSAAASPSASASSHGSVTFTGNVGANLKFQVGKIDDPAYQPTLFSTKPYKLFSLSQCYGV